MKRLKIETLSAEAADTVLAVLDLIAQLDETVLIEKGDEPLYTLSRIGALNPEDANTGTLPSQIFEELSNKFDHDRLDDIEQRKHSIKTL